MDIVVIVILLTYLDRTMDVHDLLCHVHYFYQDLVHLQILLYDVCFQTPMDINIYTDKVTFNSEIKCKASLYI